MENLERGERGGVILDGDGAPEEGAGPEEGTIDAAIAADKKANEVVDVESGDANPDGGAEVPEDGKVDGEAEVEVDPNGEGARPAVNTELEGIKETIIAEVAKLAPKPTAEAAKPLSDEEWGKLEQEWGIPRPAIERMSRQNVKIVNHLTEYIDAKFAKIEVGETIQAVAREPGFTDATRYKKDVQEFLQDYAPKHWGNPALIKRAVIYARGLNAGKDIQRARTDSERNKKVGGPARPASPSGGMKKPAMPALNGAHREVANLMGSEAEYNKFRARPTRQIE